MPAASNLDEVVPEPEAPAPEPEKGVDALSPEELEAALAAASEALAVTKFDEERDPPASRREELIRKLDREWREGDPVDRFQAITGPDGSVQSYQWAHEAPGVYEDYADSFARPEVS